MSECVDITRTSPMEVLDEAEILKQLMYEVSGPNRSDDVEFSFQEEDLDEVLLALNDAPLQDNNVASEGKTIELYACPSNASSSQTKPVPAAPTDFLQNFLDEDFNENMENLNPQNIMRLQSQNLDQTPGAFLKRKKQQKIRFMTSSLKVRLKPERRSRSRKFKISEVYCFICKIKFKKPQSLTLHHMHRHTKLNIKFL